jgi:hypothetical protein
MGHRQCIGRNIAIISIVKIVTTLMRNYGFEVLDTEEMLEVRSVGIAEKKGELMVRARRRNDVGR